VQALTTQINLVRMASAQLVVFIEKQAGECMTPSPPEGRNWSQKEGVFVMLGREETDFGVSEKSSDFVQRHLEREQNTL